MSPKFSEGLLVLKVPLIFLCIWRFCTRLRSGQGLFDGFSSLVIYAEAGEVFLTPNLLDGICFCCQISLFLRFLLSLFFGLLLVSKGSLVSLGSKSIGRTAPRLQAISWEFFSLHYSLVIWKQRRSIGLYALFSEGLTLVPVILFIM